jgi:hypothetical protein
MVGSSVRTRGLEPKAATIAPLKIKKVQQNMTENGINSVIVKCFIDFLDVHMLR